METKIQIATIALLIFVVIGLVAYLVSLTEKIGNFRKSVVSERELLDKIPNDGKEHHFAKTVEYYLDGEKIGSYTTTLWAENDKINKTE